MYNKKRLGAGLLLGLTMSSIVSGEVIHGTVKVDETAIKMSPVTLWKTNGMKPPIKIVQVISDDSGRFIVTHDNLTVDKSVYYLTAQSKQKNSPIQLMAVLPSEPITQVVVNELTTIGSIWPNAQLFKNVQLTGKDTALLIGSEQVQNLVDVKTGFYGKTVLDGANLAESETVARMTMLADLTKLCTSGLSKDCSTFLKLSGNVTNTLDALIYIAKHPWESPKAYYDLFDKAYPMGKDGMLRDTARIPYLSYAPNDFALLVRFMGGGIAAPGKLHFDANGNLWSGQNWLPGSESNVYHTIGGGLVKLAPSGKAISPDIYGFRGQSVDGVGWGTTVTKDKVFIAGFNKRIGVFDLQGNPIGPKEGIDFGGKLGVMHGTTTAPNGDVWIADFTKSQMIHFPKGDETKGKIVQVKGLMGPFGVVVDKQNRVWVSNANANYVTRFDAENPSNQKMITVGPSPRGVALDSHGNLWVSTLMSPNFPAPKAPKGTSALDDFRLNLEALLKFGAPTGLIAAINPDGEVIHANVADGNMLSGWGLSVDGNNNIWAAESFGRGIIHICGVDGICPKGKKPGDMIFKYKSGIIQTITDTIIDDAGNVWLANNWNNLKSIITDKANAQISTKGPGSGIAVIYGVGEPVQNPQMGPVKTWRH